MRSFRVVSLKVDDADAVFPTSNGGRYTKTPNQAARKAITRASAVYGLGRVYEVTIQETTRNSNKEIHTYRYHIQASPHDDPHCFSRAQGQIRICPTRLTAV